ncbi:aspartyl-phosphate phosphatase Spo0E family protein [Fictibacillus sp. WQ 8-8]|uniref:aspartyl-phosphate phosphatase Spo0E family protein n=1 Tax=unclassified Fictibacillus TaxID=2644029 RepID=UPI0008F1BF80|nr:MULTISPECIES: aspartyl-phosphate phosphatase Spo0E family protein [unclassified Fictibacillus]MCQ6268283.1 aspartyl-phosphate phosphatase Spo0E family protein [Fictibacillus sp. WQ 8-8]SFF08701.1 Spo0E like sporulation regulatory protein [Bacillus sp. OV194]
MDRNILLREIEVSRKKMNEMSKIMPLIAEEIVEISQHIDALLNEFQKANVKNSYS